MSSSLKFILFILLLISLWLQGCTNKNEHPPELTFQVNQALLGEKFINNDLGFSFSPPKNCSPMAEEKIQKIKNQIKEENTAATAFEVEPHTFFANENDQFVCVISILPTLSEADDASAIYQESIVSHYSNNQVSQAVFNHNGFKIYQSLITNQNIVQFKLVVVQNPGKSFQVDYVIQKTIYQENVEAIESSIGSLTKLTDS